MSFINGFFMALSMFTIIPMPKDIWKEKYTSYIVLNLIFVGVVIGSLWFLLGYYLELPMLFNCFFIGIYPFVITGFLHLDGFMDTCDAILSRRDLITMRKILKDSNVGAFSVISLVLLIIFQLISIFYIIEDKEKILIFLFLPMVSRGVVSILLMKLNAISEKGYMYMFKKDTKPYFSHIIIALLVFIIIVSYFISFKIFFSLIITIIVALGFSKYLYGKLEGFSGDLCGFVLTVSEVVGLFFIALL